MARPAAVIRLSAEEQKALQQCLRSGTSEQRSVERARIVLLASQGHGSGAIAAILKTRPARVSKWRRRFERLRLAGLEDGERSGKPRRYDDASERRILAQLDQPPPKGHAAWTGGLLAGALAEIRDDEVWRVLRKHGISLQRGAAGASATTRSLPPRPPMWWGSISARPSTRWCCRSTKSLRFRRSNAIRAGSGCPMDMP